MKVLIWSLITAMLMTGCGVIGGFSKIETFNGKDSLKLDVPRQDILDVISAVGKSLNYKISYLDRERNIIGLTNESSQAAAGLIGSANMSRLTITVKNEGRILDIDVLVGGNFGKGGEDRGTAVVTEFKDKLLAYIKQK